MNRTEFLQGLKSELEGRVPYSVIQENLRYYDGYIADEVAKGTPEEEVIQGLGGPRIIARTIVDAAYDTEDRPDGYDSFGGTEETQSQTSSYRRGEEQMEQRIHYIDFGKWYVRLAAGLAVFLVIFIFMSVFFGLLGLAGWILSYIWPVLLVMMILWMFWGPGHRR